MNLIRFAVRNSVAVNLTMVVVVGLGLFAGSTMIRELFPYVERGRIRITVRWPGASPDDVEKAITLRIERKLDGLESVAQMETRVQEGVSSTLISLDFGADANEVLNDVRTRMDDVRPEFPQDANEPEIEKMGVLHALIEVVLFGDVSETRLREEARRVRAELLGIPEISDVQIVGVREPELWIEVQARELQRYGLTFREVGAALATSNIDVPLGQLKSRLGNIRVRTLGETDQIGRLEQIIVRSRPDGTRIRLKDVAIVREAFADTVEKCQFEGLPACRLLVMKLPTDDSIVLTGRVKEYVARHPTRLGGALSLALRVDDSRYISERIRLMLENTWTGLLLVLVTLVLLMNLRLAFWVALGIPTSVLGTLLIMKLLGMSINTYSIGAIILSLGLVVDDAIVVAENIYKKLRAGIPALEAAESGAREMAIPVLAASLTTMAAFLPLMFLEGRAGVSLQVLPMVVITTLSVSLLECFYLLTGHMAHAKFAQRPQNVRWWHRLAAGRDRVIERVLPEQLERILRVVFYWRCVAMAATAMAALLAIGLVLGGKVPFVLLQRMDDGVFNWSIETATGTPVETTVAAVEQLERVSRELPEVRSVVSVVGTAFYNGQGKDPAKDPATVAQLSVELLTAEERQRKGMRGLVEVRDELQRRSSGIGDIRRMSFVSSSRRDIEVVVYGERLEMLARAVAHIRGELASYDGTTDLDDNLSVGKRELHLRLRDSARSLGLTTGELAAHVRHALFGLEAQELQREEDEVKVRVLLPQTSRRTLSELQQLMIPTPNGNRIPLNEAADVHSARGFGSLSRVDGRRAVTVAANVDHTRGNVAEITSDLRRRLADLNQRFPGVTLSFEGTARRTRESLGSLYVSFPVAFFLVYGIIAVFFRSYTTPLLIMTIVPLAFLGAIFGHYLLSFPFTFVSFLGCIGLMGIVVNDGILLVAAIHQRRRAGESVTAAAVAGTKSRMRPIMITTITTIAGLTPLIFEQGFGAQMLVPLAISIAAGEAFSTVLMLVLVPTLYLIGDDLQRARQRLWSGALRPHAQPDSAPAGMAGNAGETQV